MAAAVPQAGYAPERPAADAGGSLHQCNLPVYDKVLITFNYKERTQTVTFGEAAKVASAGNGSDLDCIPASQERQLLIAVFFVLSRNSV